MAKYATNTKIVLGKLETVAGTLVAPESADYTVKFTDHEMTVDIASERKKFASGNHNMAISVPGMASASFKGSADLAWSGSYAVAPDAFKFAQACGHKVVEYKRAIVSVVGKVITVGGTTCVGKFAVGQTITLLEGSTTQNVTIATGGVAANALTVNEPIDGTYTNAGFVYSGVALQPLMETDATTISIDAYERASGVASPVSNKLSCGGFSGSLEVKADGTGKPITLEFDMQGKYSSLSEVAYASTPIFAGNCQSVGDTLMGATVTIGGSAIGLSKFSLNANNSVTKIDDGSDASGILSGIIEKREPTFTVDPYKGSATTDNAYASALAATAAEIVVNLSHFQIRVPNAQSVAPKAANRNGVETWEKTYECQGNCTTAGAAIDAVLPVEAAYEIIQGKRC
jgi:hypothetical protein